MCDMFYRRSLLYLKVERAEDSVEWLNVTGGVGRHFQREATKWRSDISIPAGSKSIYIYICDVIADSALAYV